MRAIVLNHQWWLLGEAIQGQTQQNSFLDPPYHLPFCAWLLKVSEECSVAEGEQLHRATQEAKG